MFTPKRHLSIDIGSRNVKLLELVKERGSYQLLRIRSVPIYYEPQSGYIPQYDEALKQAVITALPRDIKGSVSMVISGQSVFLRFVRIPRTTHGRLDQIVHYEAEQQVPFPLEEVVWDYQVIKESDAGEDVVLVAVKKELINSLLSSFSEEDININLVDSAPLALYNALSLSTGHQEKVILDIGAKTTNLLIPEGEKLWARTIMIAGDDITKAIAAKQNISFQEAEDLKIKFGLSPEMGLEEPANSVLTDLLTEISSSVGYYKSQSGKERNFTGILLTGGSANLKGMSHYIEDNLGIAVKTVDFFSKIKFSSQLRLEEADRNIYGAALGAALRELESVPLRTNLLPEDKIKSLINRRRRPHQLIAALCLIVSLLGLNGIALENAREHRENIMALTALKNEFQNYRQKITQVKKDISFMQNKLDILNDMASAKSFWLELLLELSQIVGEDVWLVSMNKEEEGLSIEGRTNGSFTRISELKNKLNSSEFFDQVEIESADLVAGNLKSFRINMRLARETLE